MAQRLWLLVEWVDERNVFPSYGIVNVNSIVNDGSDLRPGKTIFLNVKQKNCSERATILRISDSKSNIKEHKMMLERQDQQMKSVFTLCMRTITEMKAGSGFYGLHDTNDRTLTGSNSLPHVIANSDSSDSESETGEGRRSSRSKYNDRHNASQISRQNQKPHHSSTLHQSGFHKQSMVSSTPHQKRRQESSLSFDQATQTDDNYLDHGAQILQMESIILKLHTHFLSLTSQLQNVEEEASINVTDNDQYDNVISDVEHNNYRVEGDEEIAIESVDIKNDQPNARALEVRRVSAHTTNSGEPIDSEMVPIGEGNVTVPTRVLREIDWSSYTNATRHLLKAVFPRRILATHSLTGRRSPAFADKPPKNCLDPKMVEDIVNTVSDRCGVPRRLVRNAITIKCTDETKLYRNRLLLRQMRQGGNENQENHPPSASPSSEDSSQT